MKVIITSNGEMGMFLVPENIIDETVLEQLSKSPIDMQFFNKQVQIIDKQFSKGAFIQAKKRENVATPQREPSVQPDENPIIAEGSESPDK